MEKLFRKDDGDQMNRGNLTLKVKPQLHPHEGYRLFSIIKVLTEASPSEAPLSHLPVFIVEVAVFKEDFLKGEIIKD